MDALALRHVPRRMCVGCRGREDQSRLLRVVGVRSATDNGVVVLRPDPTRREAGRGAYVHRVRACVELALRRRAFGRAVRMDGTLDVDDLRNWVEEYEQGSTDG